MENLGEILKNKVNPVQKSIISRAWQMKAFEDMKYIGVELQNKDKGRVFKVYKDEAEGRKYKGTTSRVISYLKDFPTPLDYEAKLKMFFKLVTNGFKQ